MSATHLEAGYTNYTVWLHRANALVNAADKPVSKAVFGTLLKRWGKEGSTLTGPLALVFRKHFFKGSDVYKARAMSRAAANTLAKKLRGDSLDILTLFTQELTARPLTKSDLPPPHVTMETVDVIKALLVVRDEEKSQPNVADAASAKRK